MCWRVLTCGLEESTDGHVDGRSRVRWTCHMGGDHEVCVWVDGCMDGRSLWMEHVMHMGACMWTWHVGMAMCAWHVNKDMGVMGT